MSKFEDDGIKSVLIDVRDLQPEDNRWRVSWDAACVDDETIIDVYRCIGIANSIIEMIKEVIYRKARLIVVQSSKGTQRGPIIAASIVDCLNILIGEQENRLINASRFDASTALTNSEIAQFVVDVRSWLKQSWEHKVQTK